MVALAILAALLAAAGVIQSGFGLLAVARFATASGRSIASGRAGSPQPGVSVLKPLHGSEPLLEQALSSFCAQRYPVFEVVFGAASPTDPALAVARRIEPRFPGSTIKIVADPVRHGANGKVSNLINMMRAAHHEVIVVSDSDMHVTPNYLESVVDTLASPGTGLVTAVYTGMPVDRSIAARLGASAINHSFLPGALLSRWLGRGDCLGATMALRRETLANVGGFEALVDHLADDNELGRRVRGLGLVVRLAPALPATTVAETTLAELWWHELRWGRTIRALLPGPYAASALQYPIFWAMASVLLAAAAPWSVVVLVASWTARAGTARAIDRVLGLGVHAPIWLMPLRDVLSMAVLAASFAGSGVRWRGEILRAGRPRERSVASESGREAIGAS
jgi:ceramide glucosyltransferase